MARTSRTVAIALLAMLLCAGGSMAQAVNGTMINGGGKHMHGAKVFAIHLRVCKLPVYNHCDFEGWAWYWLSKKVAFDAPYDIYGCGICLDAGLHALSWQ